MSTDDISEPDPEREGQDQYIRDMDKTGEANALRASSAANAMRYLTDEPTDHNNHATALRDALTNLRHYADAYCVDYVRADAMAKQHWQAEIAEVDPS